MIRTFTARSCALPRSCPRAFSPGAKLLLALAASGSLGLQACSSMRTSLLRDARVLDRGENEAGLEFSSTVALSDRTLGLAKQDNGVVRAVVDSSGESHNEITGVPLWGATFSHGLGADMQVDVSTYFGLIPWDAVAVEAGLKNRYWENGETSVASYLRLAAGMAKDKVESRPNPPWFTSMGGGYADLRTRSFECDAFGLTTTRWTPASYVYANVGVGGGSVFYDFRPDDEDPPWSFHESGRVDVYGLKTYVGLILEFTGAEITLEFGYQYMNYGAVPSLALKGAWVKPGSKH
ncbi:MAG: hypothetical protein ABIW76_20335 [Fibrobacteria bacterium]